MNKQERAVLKAAIDKYGNDSQLAVASKAYDTIRAQKIARLEKRMAKK